MGERRETHNVPLMEFRLSDPVFDDLSFSSGLPVPAGSPAAGTETEGEPHSPADSSADGHEGSDRESPDSDDNGSDEPPKKESVLDRVRKALGLKNDGDADSQESAEPEKSPSEEAPDDDAGDKKTPASDRADDGKTSVPPEVANHPAYKKMEQDIAASQDAVQRYGAITTYMQDNAIQPQQMTQAMELCALAVNDPEQFYNRIVAIQQDYAVALKKSLPSDLQQEVDDGVMSEARAFELSSERMKARQAEAAATQANQRLETRTSADNAAAQQAFASRWLDQTAKKDPFVGQKVEAITGEYLRLSHIKGAPKDQSAQLAMLDEAHKNVSQRMAAARPSKPTPKVPEYSASPRAAKANVKSTRRDKLLADINSKL